jgi:hypothetical protein
VSASQSTAADRDPQDPTAQSGFDDRAEAAADRNDPPYDDYDDYDDMEWRQAVTVKRPQPAAGGASRGASREPYL